MNMKPAPDVTFHSIIGSIRPGDVTQTTDGVVPYRSSHIDGMASEKTVRSDHSVQKNGEAIGEVNRILREHLGQQSSDMPKVSLDAALKPVAGMRPSLPPLPSPGRSAK